MIKQKIIFNLLIISLIFFLDRASKVYILNVAESIGIVDITLSPFLNIILVWNTGIGFGLFQLDQAFAYNLITILIVIINVVIIYLLIYADKLNKFFFSMILGGSIGNLYDRIYYSAVPDFIDLNYNGCHWSIFDKFYFAVFSNL